MDSKETLTYEEAFERLEANNKVYIEFLKDYINDLKKINYRKNIIIIMLSLGLLAAVFLIYFKYF